MHSPSLKILVYDGWSKVPVPITEADLAEARAQRLKKAKKAKARVSDSTLGHAPAGGSTQSNEDEGMVMGADSGGQDKDDDDDDETLDWCNYVNQYDVCITTYPVLQQDLGLARPPPDRPRRTIATYLNIERPRSPLVMCEWYRVIMDEVQMVGGGNTECVHNNITSISLLLITISQGDGVFDPSSLIVRGIRDTSTFESGRLDPCIEVSLPVAPALILADVVQFPSHRYHREDTAHMDEATEARIY